MKILLTGISGQVGYELQRSVQGLGELIALDRTQFDLGNPAQMRDVLRTLKPQLIVNPAAYTAVDQAEAEPQLAHRINAEAPAIIADEAKKIGAALIHYSTDYVFDGSQRTPYVETDATGPINQYGLSKLAGEQAIIAAGIPHLIFRTSWVYGLRGKNFLLTMLRLAREREQLRIVADQFGAPTWSRTIADATAHVVGQLRIDADRDNWWQRHGGIYHLCAQGKTNWCEFAQAIVDHRSVSKKPEVVGIASTEYPLPAARPQYSQLSCVKFIQRFCGLPDWRVGLRLCMD